MSTSTSKRPTKAFGWHIWHGGDGRFVSHDDVSTKSAPWKGLTPEEAYRKGVKDGERHQREQERLRWENDNPKGRPTIYSDGMLRNDR